MLWGRSANRCAYPNCRRILIEDKTETDDASIVGDEAHIVSRKKDGPRGASTLTAEERDKFENLILLCKIHHKIIDDQTLNYTVDNLKQMKAEHIQWVEKNLTQDVDKQREDEIYASYIDKWIELIDLHNWQDWTSFIFGSGQPRITLKQLDNLRTLELYIFSRIWPKRYNSIEFAFNNFRFILSDFNKVFEMHKEKIDDYGEPWYFTEKLYNKKIQKSYNELVAEYNYHVDLVQDLACELTRSANYLCDQIRKYISSSFRIKEGSLLIVTGPNIDLNFVTHRLEFTTNDIDIIKYPGLEKFMEIRKDRGFNFGKGVNEKYLEYEN